MATKNAPSAAVGAYLAEHREHMHAMALNLAESADAVAATLEKLAATREGLADAGVGDVDGLRESARRARARAIEERQEAERLRLFGGRSRTKRGMIG